MKYFYEYKYKNGGTIGGHNLERIEFHDDYIRLSGVDIIPTTYDYERHYWSIPLDLKEIEYLTIKPMEELEGSDSDE